MSYETEDKMVSHPDHYQSGKYEVIDIIDEFTKDLSGTEAVCTANAIKYILRWKKKNGIQDVKKAIWYLTHLVEHLESQIIHADPECAKKMKEFEDSIDISRELEFVQTGKWPEREVHSCDDCEFMKCDPWDEPCHSCDLHLDPPSKWVKEDKEREEHAEFDEYRFNKLTMPVDASRSSEGINKEVKLEPGCDKCEISECRFLKDPFMNPPYDQLWKDHEQLEKKYANMTDYAADMERNYCEAENKIEELEDKCNRLMASKQQIFDEKNELLEENKKLKKQHQTSMDYEECMRNIQIELEAKNQKLWNICKRLTDDNKELEDENLQLKADYQNLEEETKDKLVALTKENCQLREEIERLRETYETEAPFYGRICGSCKHFNPDQGRCTFDMHFPEKDYWDDACKYFFAKPDNKVVLKQEVTKKETE